MVRNSESAESARLVIYGRVGFTLVELLMAVALLAIALTMAFSAFHNMSRAWQRGTAMSENIRHGEYAMELLAAGLRSAFYPPERSDAGAGRRTHTAAEETEETSEPAAAPAARANDYGFLLEKNGSGHEARDVISWVKKGGALLPPEDPLGLGVQRVRVSVEADEDGETGLAVRAWRPYGMPDFFVPESEAPFFVCNRVLGFSCRVAFEQVDETWDWLEKWEEDATNRLPMVVEAVLYLQPPEPGDEPVTVRRWVEIPLAGLSWSDEQ